MIEQIAAWVVLGVIWLFVVPVIFIEKTPYKNVLLGWGLLNALVVIISLAFLAAGWAIVTVFN